MANRFKKRQTEERKPSLLVIPALFFMNFHFVFQKYTLIPLFAFDQPVRMNVAAAASPLPCVISMKSGLIWLMKLLFFWSS